MKLSIALTAAIAATLSFQISARADDCAWARSMGAGDLCDTPTASTPAPVQAADHQSIVSLTICNDTIARRLRDNTIHVIAAYGPNSNRVTSGLRLLQDDQCVTFNMPGKQGDIVRFRAVSIHNPDRVFTRAQGNECYADEYYREIPSSTRDACDRTSGSTVWAPFEIYRVPRDLTINVSIAN